MRQYFIATQEKLSLELIPVEDPIREFVTKFGGQPVWYESPQWPVSASSGNLLEFIGQINLDDAPFDTGEARMAYLFMNHEIDYSEIEPAGEECAVIIQPGTPQVSTVAQNSGPSARSLIFDESGKRHSYPREYTVAITRLGETFSFASGREAAADSFEEIKIGGCPVFFDVDQIEWKSPERCRLLLQLPPSSTSLRLNVYDNIPFVVISEAGDRGWFLME